MRKQCGNVDLTVSGSSNVTKAASERCITKGVRGNGDWMVAISVFSGLVGSGRKFTSVSVEMELTIKESFQHAAGRVDAWLVCLPDLSSTDLPGLLQLLSEPERTKWQRFAVKDARLQYLVTRALVRTTLSRYAEVPARSWKFEENAYGRPHISSPREFRDLRFNLSNTTGLVACAISRDCEIGIDVENIARIVETDELAPSVFAPAELADFRGARQEDRRDRFFSYWTLKESYIKARGMGLSLPLDAFWFELGGASPLLRVTDRCGDTPGRWRFYQYAPTNEHMMAVAVAAPQGVEPSIQVHWVTPMSMKAELS
jgi:4'-phosphopantetheinyl transferase